MVDDKILNNLNIDYKLRERLAPYTTIGVGGEAEILFEVENYDDLIRLLKIAKENKIPYLILGNGSNVVISDYGFPGIVIINRISFVELVQEHINNCDFNKFIKPRYDNENKVDYIDYNVEKKILKIGSGILLSKLRKKLYDLGLVGLEYFTGIPATLGGAIYMNAHGKDIYMENFVNRIAVISKENDDIKIYDKHELRFDYDYSILHETKETIIYAEMCFPIGNIEEAKKIAGDWAKYKKNQPQKSAGCVFRNLTEQEKKEKNLPTVSIGYVIDKVLGLKGKKIGGAVISQKHAAFIENSGEAKAQDIFELVNFIKREAKNKLGLNLKKEIEFIGKF